MNEHEIERISAAIHQLRPDWPASSLKTLITKKLTDRPRRDVAVALAWVACEPNTATPARVLEPGPWWRAAAVEGFVTPTGGRLADQCRDCFKALDRCVCPDGPTTRPQPAADGTEQANQIRTRLGWRREVEL